ncbi:hypothetical protein GGTG_00748 [Gaeumannomyces tritici R3-111a-1]|uniref:Major facilitator superfamily (MFS) profile domain-containing protein n=1 Tax=Gaeumannomyces tritici (strain R3-111a-1) TaxID=644352 RepID=J3NHL1_GAET3|nr:hypothetical protein GGTG_00748 [Gaeumannomyces tritici R3-111a-1]EJT80754.1 hypothetical protein GGTG_00748 [Gaeumannomyces tritici R3-111a-1]
MSIEEVAPRLRVAGQFALYILFNFVTLLLEVPIVRLLEHAICYRRLGGDGAVDERNCKIPAVQDSLASITGWKMFFDAVPGLVMAVYYGSLADRSGRRIVLALSAAGYTLMLGWVVVICSLPNIYPVSLVWVSSLLFFIGGGQRIFNSIVFTLISDSLDESKRARRLFLLAVGPHTCRLISPVIASVLMEVSIRAPFWLAFSCLALIFAIIPFVEDASVRRGTRYTRIEASSEVATSDGDAEPGESTTGRRFAQPNIRSWCGSLMTGAKHVAMSIYELFNTPAGWFCLASFFLKRVAFASEGFAFQYASEKFGWELRQTTWLRTASAAGAVVVTLAVGPIVGLILRRREVPAAVVDLNTIRSSLAMLIVSFFAAWKAPSMEILIVAMVGCGLGEALEPALQAFALASTDSSRNAQLFTTIAQCDTLAELVGGPLMAALLSIGRGKGHPSAGINFIASSSIFMVLLGSSLLSNINR